MACGNAGSCAAPSAKCRATTDSNHSEKRFPKLRREVVPVRPNQICLPDLTYIRVQQGFIDLACMLDSFTREVVGWSMPAFLDAKLPLVAQGNAPQARCPAPGLPHH